MKLNYTNRKITGSKLGSAVKRDLLKHVPSTSKSIRIPKDPHVDLNLQGKSLCDEGLQIACEGLLEAIGSGCVKLDELNLVENKITLDGLKSLGVVVRLARNDLKDLDLSCNCIEITTEENAADWEAFLECFRNVCSLRRLDISQNPIGDRGIEIFLKVYAREPPITLPRLVDPAVAESSDEEFEMEFEADMDDSPYERVRSMNISDSKDSSTSPKSFLSSPPKSSVRSAGSVNRYSPSPPLTISIPANSVELHGLRSIPYLVLSNTGITDKAALFLSYIIPIHPTPERLWVYLPRPRLGSQAEIFENYDHTSGCTGIIYQPNDNFTIEGLRVLHLAEGMRDGYSLPYGNSNGYGPRSRRVSDVSMTPSTAMKGARRDSFSAIPPSPHSPTTITVNGGAVTELERARRKIHGSILRDSGPGCVELWKTALRTLVVSRAILFDDAAAMDTNLSLYRRNLSQSYTSPPRPVLPTSDSLGSFCSNVPPEVPSPNEQNGGLPQSVISPTSPPHSASYMSLPCHHHHIGNHSQRSEFDVFPSSECSVTPTMKNGILTPPTPRNNGLHTKVLCGGLPEEIWHKIIALATDPKDILTQKQRRNVFEWARTKETLEREREIAGKPTCNQIWKLLEGLDCLGIEI